MGFLDTLLGRTKPVQPKLDDLLALAAQGIESLRELQRETVD